MVNPSTMYHKSVDRFNFSEDEDSELSKEDFISGDFYRQKCG